VAAAALFAGRRVELFTEVQLEITCEEVFNNLFNLVTRMFLGTRHMV